MGLFVRKKKIEQNNNLKKIVILLQHCRDSNKTLHHPLNLSKGHFTLATYRADPTVGQSVEGGIWLNAIFGVTQLWVIDVGANGAIIIVHK